MSTSRSAGSSTRSTQLGYGDNTLDLLHLGRQRLLRRRARTARSANCWPRTASPPPVSMHMQALDELGGLDVLGSPKVDNQYHAGWAWAGSAPYKGMKLLASHLGGTRNPMAVRWPARIAPEPDTTHPVPPLQRRRAHDLRGASASPRRAWSTASRRTRSTASASPTPSTSPTRRAGCGPSTSRSWAAARSTTTAGWPRPSGPRAPWIPGLPEGIASWTPDQDEWELYDLDEDWSQADDLAAQMPEKLAQMKETVRDRGGAEQRLPHRRRPLGPDLPPRAADLHALPRVELHRRHHPHARVLRARAGQPRQPGHHRPGRPCRAPTACCTRSAGPAAGSPATSRTASSATSTTCSSSCGRRSAPSENSPAGQAKIEIETVVRRAPDRPARSTSPSGSTASAYATGQVPVSAPLLFTANDCLDIGTCLGGRGVPGLLRPRAVPVQRHHPQRQRPLCL